MDSEDAYFQNTLSGEPVLLNAVDTLVTALGHSAETKLEKDLSAHRILHHIIGDCLSPRTVEEAVLEGLTIGATLLRAKAFESWARFVRARRLSWKFRLGASLG